MAVFPCHSLACYKYSYIIHQRVHSVGRKLVLAALLQVVVGTNWRESSLFVDELMMMMMMMVMLLCG